MNATVVLAWFDYVKKQMTPANTGQHTYPLLIRSCTVEAVKAKDLSSWKRSRWRSPEMKW